jgi:hypothetical protein
MRRMRRIRESASILQLDFVLFSNAKVGGASPILNLRGCELKELMRKVSF